MNDEKKVFQHTCECGSVLNSKCAVKKHLKTRKHRIFIGELPPPAEKIKPPPMKTGRKLSPDSPANITYIFNSKTSELTEDELTFRRKYFAKKQKEHREKSVMK